MEFVEGGVVKVIAQNSASFSLNDQFNVNGLGASRFHSDLLQDFGEMRNLEAD